MNIRIEISDPVSAQLKALGDDAPHVLDRSLSKTGTFYRAFVRRNYLSGQMLHRRSGKLYKSMWVKKMRGRQHDYLISAQPRLSNIYEQGAVITPKTGRVLRFIGLTRGGMAQGWVFTRRTVFLAPRRFMSQSAAVYPFQVTFGIAAESEIQKAIKQRGLA